MAEMTKIEYSVEKPFDHDSIHIGAKNVTGKINVVSFVDKDTKQVVAYAPSLQLSGYGSTDEKAAEMLRFNISELFRHLLNLTTKKRDAELSALGWKHNKLKNKEFSKAYVDVSGELKNFNADESTVKRVMLQTA